MTKIFKEIWKLIPKTKNNYQISNHGRLKTFNWKNTGKTKIMKPAINRKGYLHTVLVINGKNRQVKIHRLVAEAFIKNTKNKIQVNHKDCNKLNNNVYNLEWVTPRENFVHASKNGLCKPFLKNVGNKKNLKHLKGSEIGTSKLTIKQVTEIRRKFKPRIYTRKMLAIEYNVTENCIKDIVTRKSWNWF